MFTGFRMKSYIDLYHIEHLNYLRLFKLPNPPNLSFSWTQVGSGFLASQLDSSFGQNTIHCRSWLVRIYPHYIFKNKPLSQLVFLPLKFHHFIVRFEILLYNAVGNTFRLNVYQVRGRAIYCFKQPKDESNFEGCIDKLLAMF